MQNQYLIYKVLGLNFNKFLEEIKKNEIEVLSLSKKDFNCFEIKIANKNKFVFESVLKRYKYKFDIIKRSLFLDFIKIIKKNIALFLVALIMVLSLSIVSNFVLQIKIIGNSGVSHQKIEEVLAQNKIFKGKLKNTYNLKQIELLLKNSVDQISLVSCILKGNTLLININEKIDNNDINRIYNPIVAPYDMIIKNVLVKSGTSVVKKNDTIKTGEVIVQPYINYKDGSKLKVEARAQIEAYIELSNSLNYFENHEEMVKTGKKHVQTEYSLFGFSWTGGANDTIKFKDYQVEKQSYFLFNNMILPIKKQVTYYYEVKPKQVFKMFDKYQEQKLICENENLLYNTIEDKTIIKDYQFLSTTKKTNNMYIVTTYLKANVLLKY